MPKTIETRCGTVIQLRSRIEARQAREKRNLAAHPEAVDGDICVPVQGGLSFEAAVAAFKEKGGKNFRVVRDHAERMSYIQEVFYE